MSHRGPSRHANPGTTEGIADELALIEHSQSCTIGDAGPEERCPDQRCQQMKSVLYHGLLCDRGDCCYVEGCYQIRHLEKHLRRCMDEDCGPCNALRDRELLIARGESPKPPKSDPLIEKRRLLIQLLEFILHMHTCQLKDSRTGDCGQINCEDLEEALLHKPVCQLDAACPFPGCMATGYALSHWKICECQDCLICEPVRLNLQNNVFYRRPRTYKPRNRYFITQHIEQLLHALTCAERDRDLTREIPNCPRPNCELMKSLLLHLHECDDEKCKRAQCSSSKRILMHCTACQDLDCPSCADKPKHRPTPRVVPPSAPGAPAAQPPRVPQIPDMYPASMVAPPLDLPPESREAAQTMLLALLHAHKCAMKSRIGDAGLELHPCEVKGCRVVLEAYHHLLQCENYVQCEDRCTLSRRILHHWNTCKGGACALCFL